MKVGRGTIIEEDVEIGKNVRIGDYCIVYSGVKVGDNTRIGPFCILGHPTKIEMVGSDFSLTSSKISDLIIKDPVTEIGKNSIIRSHSVLYKHIKIGDNFSSGHRVLIREHSRLGDFCVVGSDAILGGYTKIGDKSKIETGVFVAQSVRIGKGVFISPYVSFYDNKKIILGQGLSGAIVEDFARIGGCSKILPGIRIGKYALVGAGAIVTKDVPEKAIVFGAPAKVKGYQKDGEIKKYVDTITIWE
jgi:acetyltransferase-like isoleucine patch superfamily enzyme